MIGGDNRDFQVETKPSTLNSSSSTHHHNNHYSNSNNSCSTKSIHRATLNTTGSTPGHTRDSRCTLQGDRAPRTMAIARTAAGTTTRGTSQRPVVVVVKRTPPTETPKTLRM